MGNCFLNGFLNMVDTLVFGGGICLIRFPIGTQSAHRHIRLAMSATTMAMKAIVSAGCILCELPSASPAQPFGFHCQRVAGLDHGLNLFGQRIAGSLLRQCAHSCLPISIISRECCTSLKAKERPVAAGVAERSRVKNGRDRTIDFGPGKVPSAAGCFLGA